jgi:hypothetical protein
VNDTAQDTGGGARPETYRDPSGGDPSGGDTTAGETSAGTYCDHCGVSLGSGGHEGCRTARRLEPPRYCAKCRRRLVVQVTPQGWSARCSRHGPVNPGA